MSPFRTTQLQEATTMRSKNLSPQEFSIFQWTACNSDVKFYPMIIV